MNIEQNPLKATNIKKANCPLCLRKVQKFTLLKCVTCEQLKHISIMCTKCKRNHSLTNTHKGVFVLAYPGEVIEL